MTSKEFMENEIRAELALYKECFGTTEGFKEYFKDKVEREIRQCK